MRVSLQWLKELVIAPQEALDPTSLAERLSVAGFEVEQIDDLASQVAGVVVGFVTDRQAHPDATKLSVCQVDVGAASPLQIVCGAANVRAGIHVPVALVGATLPAVNLTIKPAELRGIASSGMICSLSELGLGEHSDDSERADGIAILDDLLELVPPVGSPVAASFGLDDCVLELAITANRPDGLSMLGIAREVAALVGGRAHAPEASPIEAGSLPLPIEVQAAVEQGGLIEALADGGLGGFGEVGVRGGDDLHIDHLASGVELDAEEDGALDSLGAGGWRIERGNVFYEFGTHRLFVDL